MTVISVIVLLAALVKMVNCKQKQQSRSTAAEDRVVINSSQSKTH